MTPRVSTSDKHGAPDSTDAPFDEEPETTLDQLFIERFSLSLLKEVDGDGLLIHLETKWVQGLVRLHPAALSALGRITTFLVMMFGVSVVLRI